MLSAAGRALLAELSGQDADPDRALALAGALRRRYPVELVAAALTQQALRAAARAKFTLADQMLFTRSGLEQASSELTARHAAARFAGARLVADLCCGIGGNLAALAASPVPEPTQATTTTQDTASISTDGPLGALETPQRAVGVSSDRLVVAVEMDLTSLEFARHNASVCAPAAAVRFVCADVTRMSLSGGSGGRPPGRHGGGSGGRPPGRHGGIDAVFIDPARRNEAGRLPAGTSQPPLGWCLRLAEPVPAVGIKAAPGLRRDRVPPGWETEFVAVGRELKEALLWSPALAGATTRATVLPSGDTLAATAPVTPARLAAPGEFLLDPSPAVTRAGLVAELARITGAWQIDPMIAFLSCDQPARTPFARTLRVVESAPWHEKRFTRRLRELGIGSVDIRRRGLAGDVAQIRRRLDLRGAVSATLVLTRVNDQPWGLICVPPDA